MTKIDHDADHVTFTNVPIDSQGYDQGGTYWGRPSNLFRVQDCEGNVEYRRGRQSDIVSEYPNAVFLETRWVLYWHFHECPDCGECKTSPSEWPDSALCDCGAYIESHAIFDTEAESRGVED